MKNILFLILIAFLAISCSSDDDGGINSTLIGEWNWVKSTGGLSGSATYTPESTGENIKLIISSDSIRRFKNGDLLYKVKYKIELIDINGESSELIVTEPQGISQFFEVNENTLILTDYCNDCFVNEYIKE